jgi:hypothetical protein
MKCGGKTALWVLMSVWCVTDAKALVSGTGTYEAIVERNVFNLHPPAKAPSADELAAQNKVPPPKITLTGITTILGKKVTFLTVPPTKPGTPPEAMMLSEGQAQSEIEVKSIDEKASVVKVVNHGVEQTLDFDQNGAAKPSGPPAGSVPTPLQLPPPPGAPPPNVSTPPPAPNFIRPVRPGNRLPERSPPLSSNPMGGGFGSANPVGNQQSESLTPEETTLLIEAQRMKMMQENDPTAKVLPPTEFTHEITGEGPAPQ